MVYLMNTIIDEFKQVFHKHRTMILLGAVLTLLMSLYFIIWHYTIITFGSFYSVLDVKDSFRIRTSYYLVESFMFASIICAVLAAVNKPLIKKIFIGVVLAVFTGSEVIRMFDWGAIFFGGNHVDSNFWTHAFYTDGMVFLFAKESIALYIAFILFFAAMFQLLKKMYILSCREK
jgi:hypothetical protein